MRYTVKELARISNVTARTIHWYDKQDLLKPSFYGPNGYRYYEEQQLLTLQQILFFKELGFCLKDIRKLLSQGNFDLANALQTHKALLEKDIERKSQLIATLDRTLSHLERKETMSNEDFYRGFDKQKDYETYLIKYSGGKTEELVKESRRRTATWDKKQWETVKSQGDALYKELAKTINAGFTPESTEVQKIIHLHYQLLGRFYTITKQIYKELPSLYAEHPDFKKFFRAYHPKMINFIGEAMCFYANNSL